MSQLVLTLPEDLRAELTNVLQTEFAPLILFFKAQIKPPEELMTQKEVAKLLGITVPTVWKYTKDGILTGYRIGATVRYKRSEILASLSQTKGEAA